MLTASHAAIAAAAISISAGPLAAQTEVSAAQTEHTTHTEPAAKADLNETAAPAADEASTEAPGPVTAAQPTDFRTGIEVRDATGGMVGTVESVDSDGAVVFTGNVRAKLPFQSFGKNNLGLVISLSRAELEAAATAQQPS